MSDGEEVVPTHHDRIRVLRLHERPAHADDWLSALEACVEAGHVQNAVSLLRSLVPSYRPSQALVESAASPASPVSRVA